MALLSAKLTRPFSPLLPAFEDHARRADGIILSEESSTNQLLSLPPAKCCMKWVFIDELACPLIGQAIDLQIYWIKQHKITRNIIF